MKYRIKTIQLPDGRREYYPQVKKFFKWWDLCAKGTIIILPSQIGYDSWENAKACIANRKNKPEVVYEYLK